MPSYRIVEPEVDALVQTILQESYPDLVEVGLTALLLFAHAPADENGELRGNALKLHGYPALAIVRLTSLKDRVAGLADVRIEIDGDAWPAHSEIRKKAILDHELRHIVVVRDEDGRPRFDDANRPRLRLCPHDFQVGGFHDVISRHGMEAVEAEAYRDLHRRMTQTLLPWG